MFEYQVEASFQVENYFMAFDHIIWVVWMCLSFLSILSIFQIYLPLFISQSTTLVALTIISDCSRLLILSISNSIHSSQSNLLNINYTM